jgi:hypothetical protein
MSDCDVGVTCLICGRRLQFANEVIGHIWFAHTPGQICWCGQEFFVFVNFESHLARCGGYFEHYLVSSLVGVRNG